MKIYQAQYDQSVPPILARGTLLTQLRKATGMVGVIDYYDRLPHNHPEMSYEWLIAAVRSRLDRLRAEEQRAKQGA
eukprot:3147517-Alexandrium_andersonii.AAC.1